MLAEKTPLSNSAQKILDTEWPQTVKEPGVQCKGKMHLTYLGWTITTNYFKKKTGSLEKGPSKASTLKVPDTSTSSGGVYRLPDAIRKGSYFFICPFFLLLQFMAFVWNTLTRPFWFSPIGLLLFPCEHPCFLRAGNQQGISKIVLSWSAQYNREAGPEMVASHGWTNLWPVAGQTAEENF